MSFIQSGPAQNTVGSVLVLPKAQSTDPRVRRWRRLLLALVAGIGLLVILHVLVGFVAVLSVNEMWAALWEPADAPRLHVLAVSTRLPRALLGLVVGLALGSAGALLQAVTRNPLASPEITGVSAGAVAATLVWIAFGPSLPQDTALWLQPAIATVGGLATAAVVYALARRAGPTESSRLILIGVLIGGVLASITTLSLLMLRSEAEDLLRWLSGELAFATWDKMARALAYLIPSFMLVLVAIPRANALQLGDDIAVGLGQRRERDRFLVVLAAVALTGAAVTFVGAIAFVGFIGPHFARRWVGSDLRRLLPGSALMGAFVVLTADFIARNFDLTMLPVELPYLRNPALPVGIYLSLFAIPLIIALIWRRTP